MDAPARRSRGGDDGGKRAGRAGAVTALARRPGIALALAAFAAAILPLPAAAQNPPATAAPKAQPAKPKPKSPAAAPGSTAPAAAPAANNGRQPDLAFRAFQRGYYIPALALATQDDKKAAHGNKAAAARGAREAMFTLAMFRLAGRAGPRDRDASAKWLAAAAKIRAPPPASALAPLSIYR